MLAARTNFRMDPDAFVGGSATWEKADNKEALGHGGGVATRKAAQISRTRVMSVTRQGCTNSHGDCRLVVVQ
jgi:hypothetical protein